MKRRGARRRKVRRQVRMGWVRGGRLVSEEEMGEREDGRK